MEFRQKPKLRRPWLSLLATFAGAGFAFLWVLDSQPRFLLRFLQDRHGVVYFHETNRPVVALTIDDSPSAFTPALLDLLARHKVKCTFFVLAGAAASNEALTRRILDDGHEIGNHLWADRAAYEMSRGEFESLLDQSQHALEAFGPVRWFRPPSAFYRDWMLDLANERQLKTVLGSLHPYDSTLAWTGFPVSQILRNVRPGDIIILHDGASRGERTLRVLEKILPRLKARGFEITTLSALTGE